jgi:hypothetical protein
MQDPDFTKAKDHMYARGSLINFYPDNDDSVTSGHINPLDMQENISQSIPVLKNYLKIFSTSFDGRSTKAYMPKFDGFCKDISTIDHENPEIVDMNAATCVNRADATTRLSNATQIGWWQDIDTRFDVSKYGQIRPEAPFSKDWHKTLRAPQPDQMITTSYEGAPIGRDLALFMIDFVHRKQMLHDNAQNVLFGKGLVNVNSARKMTKEDISHLIARSAAASSHANYEDARVGRPSLIPRVDLNVRTKVVINPIIVDFLNEALHLGRKNPKRQMRDLRDDILTTALDTGIYQTAANRATGALPDAHLNRETDESQTREVEKKPIQNYAGLRPPIAIESRNNATYEAYKTTSKTRANQRSRETYERKTVEDYNGDMEPAELEGLTKNRVSRGVGKKYLRDAMIFENERENDDLNSVEAYNAYA